MGCGEMTTAQNEIVLKYDSKYYSSVLLEIRMYIIFTLTVTN